MGKITIPGQFSGRNYNFTIAGDQPTETELGRMQSILQEQEGAYRAQAEQEFGRPFELDEQPGTAIGRGLGRGIPNVQRMLGAAAGAIGMEGVDDYLTSAATERQLEMLRENPALMEGADFRDVRGLGSALTYTGELLGEQLPIIGGTVAGAGAGALAGAPLVGTALATLGVSGPVLFGGNILRQEEQVAAGEREQVDISDAALAALGQTALEAASNLLLVGRLARAGTPITRRAIEGVLVNAPAEGLTEVGQQVLERAQAGLDVDSEDAYQEYLTAGVAGATLGGLFGAAGSIIPPRAPAASEDTPPTETEPAPAAPPVEPPAPGPTREITDEDMAAIGEGPTDLDPTAPITAETLATLGVPPTAPIYQQVAAERLSGPQLDAALERYAAAASTIPTQQAAAQRVNDFLQRRAAAIPGQGELPLGQPPQPQRVEPSPVGAGPVSGAPAVEQPPVSGDLGTPGGIEPPAPVGVAVPDRGVGTAPAPEAPQPAALEPAPAPEPLFSDAQPSPRPISDEDAFDLAFQEAEAARAAAPTPSVPPSSLAAQAAPPEAPPSPSADQLPALRRAARDAERRAKSEFSNLKRPVFKGLGLKLDPEGAAGQELLARGITRKDMPGLFAKPGQGLKDVDNIPADESPQIMREGLVKVADDGNNFDRNDLLDALEAEARGTPRLPAAAIEADRIRADIDRLEQALQAARAENFAPPLQPNEDPFDNLKSIEKLYGEKADPWARPLPTNIVAALQNNDLVGALNMLAASTKNASIKRLINRMQSFVPGVQVSVVDAQFMRLLSDMYGDGLPIYGFYVRSLPDDVLQDFVDSGQYSAEFVAAYRDLTNTIVLHENLGLTPITLLHEVAHAVTTATLDNESSPLTQQLLRVLDAARETIPGRVQELSNVRELVAYGMTSPTFMKDLALVPSVVDGQRVSLLQWFTNTIANGFRALIGRKRKPIRSAKDDLDMFFDAMLAPAPDYRGVGSVYSGAYTAEGSRQLMDTMKANVKLPTAAEAATAARRITNATILSPRAKSFLLDLSVPLPYLGNYAKKYLPSADRVNELVNEHAGYERQLIDWTNDTLTPIRAYFKKHGQGVVDTINKIRYEATENQYQVDPRKETSEYDQFELTQVDYNPDGTEAKRTVRRFQTRQARNAAGQRLNRNAAPGQRRAIKFVDPDAARIAKHKELRALYLGLPEGGQEVVSTLFELPEVYRKELQKVFEKRLADMLPGQRAMQERIYREVFDKLFAEALLDPYQALSRRGDFKLSYEARDPDSGELKVFKHAFPTTTARDDAIIRLEAIQEAEKSTPEAQRRANVRAITPYQSINDFAGTGVQAPTALLMSILNKVAERNQRLEKDTETAILELIFETAPETSFIQSFKKREGTPGYMGDITPLDERLSAGDTLDVIATNGYRLATKAADLRYQTEFANLRSTLRNEYVAHEQKLQQEEPDPLVRAKEQAAAKLYFDKLTEATQAPFQPVARWSQTLTALGYTMALGGNVSTAALTFFQMPLFIAPMLMAKYGGSVTTQAIGRATRVLTSSGKDPAGGRFRTVERVSPNGGIERVRVRIGMYDYSMANLDYDNDPRAAYLRPLFEAANKSGVLTRSLSQEQVDASTATGFTQKMAAWSGLMQHHAERYMREITIISDYLAGAYNKIPGMKNQMSFKQFTKAVEEGRVVIPADIAADIAADAVRTGDYANGSIYAASAPAYARTNIGRVLYLFKRFPISMMNLLIHTARRSVDDSDPVDRRVARMQLAGMSGSMALFAGASGMPLFHTVAAVYDNMWPRDEDDEDFETLVRTGFLGELGTKGLANYLFGVNLSERIGLGGVFYRPPLNSAELPWYGTIIEGYGGPVIGLGSRWARAADLYSQGEYYRGLESTLPTAMSNMMKSFRFGTEGALTMRGDPIMDIFSPYEVGAQFLGFMPARYEQQLSINRAQQDIGNAVNAEVQSLLRRLYIARREGDRDTFQETMQDIRDFNARMPPSARISRDSIRRSLDSHQRRTQEMVSGVTLSPRMRPELMQLATEYGPVSWMDQR